MAQHQITVLVDDLTGKELANGTGETIDFSVDGVRYELDTDKKAADKLRSVYAPYIAAGRRITKSGRPTRRTRVNAEPAAVRAWAASNGLQVSDRGRIPAHVLEAYHEAGN